MTQEVETRDVDWDSLSFECDNEDCNGTATTPIEYRHMTGESVCALEGQTLVVCDSCMEALRLQIGIYCPHCKFPAHFYPVDDL